MRSLPTAPRIFPNTRSPYPAWWRRGAAGTVRRLAPIVHLRRAVALIGRFPALAGVDLDVDPGEIVLLRGPERRRQDHPAAGLRRPGDGQLRSSAVVLGHDLVARPHRGAPPGRPAGPRHLPLRRPDRAPRTWTSGPRPRAPPSPRRPRCARPTRGRRAAARPAGAGPVRRSAASGVVRRDGLSPARAVAARRAPRRAGRRPVAT